MTDIPGPASEDDAERQEEDRPAEGEADSPTAKDVEKIVDALEGELVDDVPDERKLRAVRAVQSVFHSGPLPAAAWFAGIESLAPGSTKAMVDDYLEDRKHVRSLQQQALDLDKQTAKWSSRYYYLQLGAAWTIAIAALAASVVLIATGHAVYGFAAVVVQIAAVATAFLVRKDSRSSQPMTDDDTDTGPQRDETP